MKIEPCPACHGPAIITELDGEHYGLCRNAQCSTIGPVARSAEDALAKWNARVENDDLARLYEGELACCKFCGGEALMADYGALGASGVCSECGAVGPEGNTTERAAELWNAMHREDPK